MEYPPKYSLWYSECMYDGPWYILVTCYTNDEWLSHWSGWYFLKCLCRALGLVDRSKDTYQKGTKRMLPENQNFIFFNFFFRKNPEKAISKFVAVPAHYKTPCPATLRQLWLRRSSSHRAVLCVLEQDTEPQWVWEHVWMVPDSDEQMAPFKVPTAPSVWMGECSSWLAEKCYKVCKYRLFNTQALSRLYFTCFCNSNQQVMLIWCFD